MNYLFLTLTSLTLTSVSPSSFCLIPSFLLSPEPVFPNQQWKKRRVPKKGDLVFFTYYIRDQIPSQPSSFFLIYEIFLSFYFLAPLSYSLFSEGIHYSPPWDTRCGVGCERRAPLPIYPNSYVPFLSPCKSTMCVQERARPPFSSSSRLFLCIFDCFVFLSLRFTADAKISKAISQTFFLSGKKHSNFVALSKVLVNYGQKYTHFH